MGIGRMVDEGAEPVKRKLTDEEYKKNFTMMTTPRMWPAWPVCYVKQPMSTGWPRTGVILERKMDEPIQATIYEGPGFGKKGIDLDDIIAKYESFEEMLADGWVVD